MNDDDYEDHSHPDWQNHYAVPLVKCRHGRDPRRCDDCDGEGDAVMDEARNERHIEYREPGEEGYA